jgi:hypothetical protein
MLIALAGARLRGGLRNALLRRRQRRNWRVILEEGTRDPTVRAKILTYFEAELQGAERRASYSRGDAAKEDAQLLHMLLALLLIEESQLTEAGRHLSEVLDGETLSTEINELRARVVAALGAARSLREGQVPLR